LLLVSQASLSPLGEKASDLRIVDPEIDDTGIGDSGNDDPSVADPGVDDSGIGNPLVEGPGTDITGGFGRLRGKLSGVPTANRPCSKMANVSPSG
jgi:hypothetical protein